METPNRPDPMDHLRRLYRDSLALATDLYQITMAAGYWKHGMAETESVFHLFFRKNPFAGGYSVACGLGMAVEFLRNLRFSADDIRYLATLKGADDRPLFEKGFLNYLRELRFTCDIDAVPEGTAVFPHEPMLRVRGPLLQAQLLETPLLNLLNFQTLVATKAARICRAAGGRPVLEFGLRRGQGLDGAISACRASFIGGCTGTSNVLAGKLLGVPVKGTHAHSWVMAFEDEPRAFSAYAEALPANCVFLVDTYDTLQGVRHAAAEGKKLRALGQRLLGIRLDSGDLVALSRQAREILDAAGETEAAIVASNDLDEHSISKLMKAGGRVDVFGVGTRLVTAHDQPALGGVYKLAAIRGATGWEHRVKLSEQPVKVSNPGIQQVRRFFRNDRPVADVIFDIDTGIADKPRFLPLREGSRERSVPVHDRFEDLLRPAVRQGKPVSETRPLEEIRAACISQVAALPDDVTRLDSPEIFPVGLEPRLATIKTRLIRSHRH